MIISPENFKLKAGTFYESFGEPIAPLFHEILGTKAVAI